MGKIIPKLYESWLKAFRANGDTYWLIFAYCYDEQLTEISLAHVGG